MKLLLEIFGLFAIIANIKLVSCDCTDPSAILPCTGCGQNIIDCTGETFVDFDAIFTKLSKTLTSEQKYFKQFIFSNRNNTKLTANLFQDILFETIAFQDSALTEIHPDAFGQNYNYTKTFVFWDNWSLTSHVLFDVVTRFELAEYVSLVAVSYSGLDVSVLRQGHQKHLKSLELMLAWNNDLQLNGNIFKHLTALTYLSLWADNLTYIGDNAFAMDEPSNSTLHISLRDNHNLLPSSFARNSLIGINRPTSIDLSNSQTISKITYFPEDVFGPFFAANPLNVIGAFDSSNFDCQDCKSYWLKQRALFKRIPDLKCSNGKAVDDPDNFINCHMGGSYSQMPLVNRIDHGDGVNVNLKPIIIEEGNKKKIIVGDKINYIKNL
jgi:hypothetical protein